MRKYKSTLTHLSSFGGKLLIMASLLVFVQAAYSFDANYNAVKPHKSEPSIACPAEDFFGFLNAFTESETVQRIFTNNPLRKQFIDIDAEPEPKPVRRLLTHSKIKFPIFPLRAERDKRLLNVRVDSLSSRQAKVTLFKSDTDYLIAYFFSKQNSCWMLDGVEDWSL